MKDQKNDVAQAEQTVPETAPVKEEARPAVPFLYRSIKGRSLVIATGIKAGEERVKM
jgi:hypothetical protein